MWASNRNGTITIIGGCPGSSGAVTIPETINGRPVTQIEDWAFAQCSSLASLPLVNGVVSFTDPEWTNHPTRFYRVRKQ